jgi:hypothetical protein
MSRTSCPCDACGPCCTCEASRSRNGGCAACRSCKPSRASKSSRTSCTSRASHSGGCARGPRYSRIASVAGVASIACYGRCCARGSREPSPASGSIDAVEIHIVDGRAEGALNIYNTVDNKCTGHRRITLYSPFKPICRVCRMNDKN